MTLIMIIDKQLHCNNCFSSNDSSGLQSLMMHPMAPQGIGLSLALWSSSSSASPFPLQILAEGSASEEETGASAPGPSPLTTSTLPDYHKVETSTFFYDECILLIVYLDVGLPWIEYHGP